MTYIRIDDKRSKHWYQNGNLHREDGPAVEWCNGDKEWWLNGQRHRKDGPAMEWDDRSKSWYLNGRKLSEEEWEQLIKK